DLSIQLDACRVSAWHRDRQRTFRKVVSKKTGGERRRICRNAIRDCCSGSLFAVDVSRDSRPVVIPLTQFRRKVYFPCCCAGRYLLSCTPSRDDAIRLQLSRSACPGFRLESVLQRKGEISFKRRWTSCCREYHWRNSRCDGGRFFSASVDWQF